MSYEHDHIEEGEEFLNWNGTRLVFDPNFENEPRVGLNYYFAGGKLIASITWSSHEDYTFLRSAYVDPSFRRYGIFHRMFDQMIKEEGAKPVKGQWRTGGPLELFMASWNERWNENAGS